MVSFTIIKYTYTSDCQQSSVSLQKPLPEEMACLLDAVSFHFPPQRRLVDFQVGRGFSPMPVMMAKGGNDGFSFGVIKFGEGRTGLFEGLFGGPVLNLLGKMPRFDRLATAQNKRIFNDIFQLPNVSRKIAAHQKVQGIFGNPLDLLGFEGVKFSDKVLYEQRDVLGALGKGRKLDIYHIEAVEEIFTKETAGHKLR